MKCTANSVIIHALNIHSHTDTADFEVVENTGYGVGTPDGTTTGGIELDLGYSDVAAYPDKQPEQNEDKIDEESSVYSYIP